MSYTISELNGIQIYNLLVGKTLPLASGVYSPKIKIYDTKELKYIFFFNFT